LIAEIRRLGLEAEILARGAYVDGSLRPHQSGANGISIDSAAFAGLTGVHHRCKNVFTFFLFWSRFLRFADPDFLLECKISAIWRRFPLIFALYILNVRHISTSALLDLLT